MRSFSEIDTMSKRASRAKGFSWGISEEVGKCIRLLELFSLPGLKNLNQYLKDIPLVEKYLLNTSERYKDLYPLRRILDKVVS